MSQQDRAAGFGVLGSWGAWWTSHIADINQWLQFFLLIGGLVSTIYAIRHYKKRIAILDKDFTNTGSFKTFQRDDK